MSLLNRRFEQQVGRVAALIPSTVCLGWPFLGYLLPMSERLWASRKSSKRQNQKKKKTLTSIFVTLAMFNMSIWILFILFRSFCFICYFVFWPTKSNLYKTKGQHTAAASATCQNTCTHCFLCNPAPAVSPCISNWQLIHSHPGSLDGTFNYHTLPFTTALHV